MSPGPATNSLPSSMRIASTSAHVVLEMGREAAFGIGDWLHVVGPAPARLEYEPAYFAAADLDDLGAAVRELAYFVGGLETAVLGLFHCPTPLGMNSGRLSRDRVYLLVDKLSRPFESEAQGDKPKRNT